MTQPPQNIGKINKVEKNIYKIAGIIIAVIVLLFIYSSPSKYYKLGEYSYKIPMNAILDNNVVVLKSKYTNTDIRFHGVFSLSYNDVKYDVNIEKKNNKDLQYDEGIIEGLKVIKVYKINNSKNVIHAYVESPNKILFYIKIENNNEYLHDEVKNIVKIIKTEFKSNK